MIISMASILNACERQRFMTMLFMSGGVMAFSAFILNIYIPGYPLFFYAIIIFWAFLIMLGIVYSCVGEYTWAAMEVEGDMLEELDIDNSELR